MSSIASKIYKRKSNVGSSRDKRRGDICRVNCSKNPTKNKEISFLFVERESTDFCKVLRVSIVRLCAKIDLIDRH